jgi:hypothetical protein
MENGQRRFYTLRVLILGYGLCPAFIIGAYRYPSVDKAAVIRLNTAGYNIADNNSRGMNNKMSVRDYIAHYHPAYGNVCTGYITLHPRALPDHYPALRLKIASDTAVYARKTAGFYITGKNSVGTNYRVN